MKSGKYWIVVMVTEVTDSGREITERFNVFTDMYEAFIDFVCQKYLYYNFFVEDTYCVRMIVYDKQQVIDTMLASDDFSDILRNKIISGDIDKDDIFNILYNYQNQLELYIQIDYTKMWYNTVEKGE